MRIIVEESFDPAQYLLEALEGTIEKFSNDPDRIPSRTFKPSSLNCSRQAYYILTSTPNPEDTRMTSGLKGIVESGTDRHIRLQEWLMRTQEAGYDLEYIDVEEYLQKFPNGDIKVTGRDGAETKLYNSRHNMSFMCDGIVKMGGKYYIIEIKTESMWKFKYREGVAPEHVRQATAYFMNFGLPVIFLYENRDFLEKKTYLFEPTEENEEDVFRTMLQAQMGVDGNYTPEIPDNIWEDLEKAFDKKNYTQKTRDAYREGEWREFINTCKYCPYKERCESEGSGRKL